MNGDLPFVSMESGIIASDLLHFDDCANDLTNVPKILFILAIMSYMTRMKSRYERTENQLVIYMLKISINMGRGIFKYNMEEIT
jgi:hypothetical protein